MSPRRILGLAITTSALATSAALAVTGTPARAHEGVRSASAALASTVAYGDEPVTVAATSSDTHPTSEESTPSKTGKGSLIGITVKDVAATQVAPRALVSNAAPARIANVWSGFDHQPTESQVQRAEQARGVAPDAREQRRETRILRQLDQELLKSTGVAAG